MFIRPHLQLKNYCSIALHLIRKIFTQLLSNCILHVKSYMRFNVNLSGLISYTFIEAKNVWYKAEKY